MSTAKVCKGMGAHLAASVMRLMSSELDRRAWPLSARPAATSLDMLASRFWATMVCTAACTHASMPAEPHSWRPHVDDVCRLDRLVCLHMAIMLPTGPRHVLQACNAVLLLHLFLCSLGCAARHQSLYCGYYASWKRLQVKVQCDQILVHCMCPSAHIQHALPAALAVRHPSLLLDVHVLVSVHARDLQTAFQTCSS